MVNPYYVARHVDDDEVGEVVDELNSTLQVDDEDKDDNEVNGEGEADIYEVACETIEEVEEKYEEGRSNGQQNG